MERLLEDHRHERRLAHGHRPFGDRLGDRFDIDRLEVFLVEPRARRLSGDAKDRNRVGGGGVEPGDHVGAGGPGGADADADIAGLGARIAVGHMRGALDVARQDVTNGAARLHRRVKRVDRGARHAEGDNAFPLQHEHGGVHCVHSSHERSPQTRDDSSSIAAFEHRRRCRSLAQQSRQAFPPVGSCAEVGSMSKG